MHWCMDETLALLAMIPIIGFLFRKLHTWYHNKMGHTCHEKHCDDTHAVHVEEETPVKIWTPITQEVVEARFGNDLVIFLYKEIEDAGLANIEKDEVNWYVNDEAEIMVEARDEVFFHDYECCEYGWRR